MDKWKGEIFFQDRKISLQFVLLINQSERAFCVSYVIKWLIERSMRNYKLCHHILRKGCASRDAFIRKKRKEKWGRWKLWGKLSRVFYWSSLKYGGCIIIFFFWYVEKRKGHSKLTFYGEESYNYLCLLICYPLNAFVIIYAISIF